MKIYLLLGHPDTETLNGTLADTYEAEALKKGHEVRRQNLGAMHFDPILWKGDLNKVHISGSFQVCQSFSSSEYVSPTGSHKPATRTRNFCMASTLSMFTRKER